MPIGPGTYDDICTKVRNETEAQVVIVAVIGGNKGTGFSVQSHGRDVTADLPRILETIAAEIRASIPKR